MDRQQSRGVQSEHDGLCAGQAGRQGWQLTILPLCKCGDMQGWQLTSTACKCGDRQGWQLTSTACKCGDRQGWQLTSTACKCGDRQGWQLTITACKCGDRQGWQLTSTACQCGDRQGWQLTSTACKCGDRQGSQLTSTTCKCGERQGWQLTSTACKCCDLHGHVARCMPVDFPGLEAPVNERTGWMKKTRRLMRAAREAVTKPFILSPHPPFPKGTVRDELVIFPLGLECLPVEPGVFGRPVAADSA